MKTELVRKLALKKVNKKLHFYCFLLPVYDYKEGIEMFNYDIDGQVLKPNLVTIYKKSVGNFKLSEDFILDMKVDEFEKLLALKGFLKL